MACTPAAACPPGPRFPQPVLAGSLAGRTVLRPLESQPVLGHVDAVVRTQDGGIDVILAQGGFLERFGGLWGLGARPVAVPIAAMTLLGSFMEVVDLSPAQLHALPTWHGGGTPVAPEAELCVGLSRPSH